MGYQVALLNFEGPLDLLLQLIEQSDLTVTEISLAGLTSQYLEYIGQLEGLEAAELDWFIGLASKLLYLKSQALLPEPPLGEDDELADLEHQLLEYGQFRQAANALQQLLRGNTPSFERPLPVSPDVVDLPLPKVRLSDINEAFKTALRKLPAEPTPANIAEGPTIEQMQQRLLKLVAKDKIDLGTTLANISSRQEIVVLFLALLELLKHHRLAAVQNRQFGGITLCRV